MVIDMCWLRIISPPCFKGYLPHWAEFQTGNQKRQIGYPYPTLTKRFVAGTWFYALPITRYPCTLYPLHINRSVSRVFSPGKINGAVLQAKTATAGNSSSGGEMPSSSASASLITYLHLLAVL